MVFVVDVGNTNITYGVYEGEKLVTSFRLTSKVARTSDESGMEIIEILKINGISRDDIEGCIIASVVPGVMYSLTSGIKRYFDNRNNCKESEIQGKINVKKSEFYHLM